MKVKALISFSGLESMRMGEIKEILDESILNDLLKANYIEEVKEEKKAARKKTGDK